MELAKEGSIKSYMYRCCTALMMFFDISIPLAHISHGHWYTNFFVFWTGLHRLCWQGKNQKKLSSNRYHQTWFIFRSYIL